MLCVWSYMENGQAVRRTVRIQPEWQEQKNKRTRKQDRPDTTKTSHGKRDEDRKTARTETREKRKVNAPSACQLKYSNIFRSTHGPPWPNMANSTPSPILPSTVSRPHPPGPSPASLPSPANCTANACWAGSKPIIGDFARPDTLRRGSARGVASRTRSSPSRSGTRQRGSAPGHDHRRDAPFRSKYR